MVGWSMGAQQTYQWGALYPDMVARIASFCGSARTSRHNFVFLVMPRPDRPLLPPEDNEYEVRHMPNAECRPIPSVRGHIAGGPGLNPADPKFIDDALKELLAN
jgi:pimeloyl-ACP methyl ester carboxylesterase